MVRGGVAWGEAPEGVNQGASEATAEFSVGLQPSLIKLDSDCKREEGLAIAGADDVYAIGPEATVLPAFEKFKQEIFQRCGLELQMTKCRVFK